MSDFQSSPETASANYFTGKAHKIITEAAGHIENWTKYDHALLDLAREADDVCSRAYAPTPADPFNRKQVEAVCRAVCAVEGGPRGRAL